MSIPPPDRPPAAAPPPARPAAGAPAAPAPFTEPKKAAEREPDRTPHPPIDPSLVRGILLLIAVLSVFCLWSGAHLGWIVGIVGAVIVPCIALVLAILPHQVSDPVREWVSQRLAEPLWHRRLRRVLYTELVVFAFVTSVEISLDDSTSGPVKLTRGISRPGGGAADTVTLKKGRPVRRFWLAFTRLPTYSTREHALPAGRYRPYVPTRIRYSSEFDARTTLVLLPYRALFLAVREQTYRVRVADSTSAVLADTVFGGQGGPGGVTLGGEPGERLVDSLVHRRLSDQNSGMVTQLLDQSRPFLWAEPRRQLRRGERVVVEVRQPTPGGAVVLSRTVTLTDPVHVEILEPGANP